MSQLWGERRDSAPDFTISGARSISPISGAGPISLLRFPRVRNLSCLSLLREVFVRPPSGARAISGAGPISLRKGADFTAPPHRRRWRSNPSGKSSKEWLTRSTMISTISTTLSVTRTFCSSQTPNKTVKFRVDEAMVGSWS